MDPNEKGEETRVHEDMMIIKAAVDDLKFCVDCKTTKTPLWRSGPAGPKSLCNACGIRQRKRRVGKTDDSKRNQEKKKLKSESGGSGGAKKKKRPRPVSDDLRERVKALGEEVELLQRSSPAKKQRKIGGGGDDGKKKKKMGEVEEAAVLLMALSCGSIFA
ncbi:hypothetical protein M9H77_27407 [Catharanthus roseus]|uniref:Uncharacterized protein n=1 Tax=Catharanthus roseus TaxID=4058 RepID=A0ACC0ACT9_CATRO|nr:hypothetical protein M9H77_27407 [Catharanthus roseus]